ncbi:hypothetical protein C8Q79DRAFT_147486 [Trametes meyenii]|nr:hypothetical protein C8Q79DRAFT_147486 [Trametes meyenii]
MLRRAMNHDADLRLPILRLRSSAAPISGLRRCPSRPLRVRGPGPAQNTIPSRPSKPPHEHVSGSRVLPESLCRSERPRIRRFRQPSHTVVQFCPCRRVSLPARPLAFHASARSLRTHRWERPWPRQRPTPVLPGYKDDHGPCFIASCRPGHRRHSLVCAQVSNTLRSTGACVYL